MTAFDLLPPTVGTTSAGLDKRKRGACGQYGGTVTVGRFLRQRKAASADSAKDRTGLKVERRLQAVGKAPESMVEEVRMMQRRYRMNPRAYVALILFFVGGPVGAAEREVIKTSWSGFEQQVSARKLEGRAVRITPAGGGEIKTRLLTVTDSGLVVRANRATKDWASRKKDANIPRDQIRSVRFLGHVGHRGLLTGLAGFGAALGIGTALAASQDVFQITGGPAVIAVPLGIVVGAVGVGVAGYFIGRATSRQAPEFVIDQ